jgi:hypothetical protein
MSRKIMMLTTKTARNPCKIRLMMYCVTSSPSLRLKAAFQRVGPLAGPEKPLPLLQQSEIRRSGVGSVEIV